MIAYRVFVQLDQMGFDQWLERRVCHSPVVTEGILVNGNGPTHAAGIWAITT